MPPEDPAIARKREKRHRYKEKRKTSPREVTDVKLADLSAKLRHRCETLSAARRGKEPKVSNVHTAPIARILKTIIAKTLSDQKK